MTEPNDQSTPLQSAGSKAARLAIFEMVGGEKRPLGIVSLGRTESGKWNAQYSARANDAVAKIRSVVARFAEERSAADSVDKISVTAQVIELFQSAGYVAQDVSEGDHEIKFQVSLDTGYMVSTHGAKHEMAASDNQIGRRIFDSIAQFFKKAGDEVAREADALLDQNDAGGAVRAIRLASDQGILALPPSKRLLSSLVRLDISNLSPADQRFIRETRLLLAHRLARFDIAGRDAEALLNEYSASFGAEEKAALKMTVALGAIARKHPETGLSILRDLLRPPTSLSAEGRAWAWRNIARALDRSDPEARRAAQLSADSFLEAGRKQEAGESLMYLADLLMNADPSEAIARLNEIVSLLDTADLLDRNARASVLHSRANRLARLGRHKEAFRDASEAVNLSRGLIGAEEALVSSLHLAAVEASYLDDDVSASAFKREAEELTKELKLSHFQLAERVDRLAEEFDPTAAIAILREAEAAGNLEVIVAVKVFQARLDESLSHATRLEILEETHHRALAARGGARLAEPVRLAIAQLLFGEGQYERAEKWFREVLAADALQGFAQNALVACLWRQEKWGDAAIFLRKQLALRGELPGLTFSLGKSQFEAGDLSGAIATFTKLINGGAGDESLRKGATGIRERALQLAGTVVSAPSIRTTGPLTRGEIEGALDDFAHFIAAAKRMRFWIGDGKGGYQWVSGPEGRAQDLLHTFLKARFEDRVEIFEEVGAGAGRVDLYVRMEGGLAVIVELKMCGAPYSTAYAASGEEQIRHYMDNRRTNLGYLVVFDARARMFGKPLLTKAPGPDTVIEKIVDVRNRVKHA